MRKGPVTRVAGPFFMPVCFAARSLTYTWVMIRPTTLERAFELADQGFPISDIRQTLHREGYDAHHISGSVAKQLSKRIGTANATKG